MRQKIGLTRTNDMTYKIETEEDYRIALIRALEICDSSKSENELKELYVLMDLLTKYEQENCSIN